MSVFGRLVGRVKTHPLVRSYIELSGNAKACITFEPFWGIPNGLVVPYASMYQLAMGLTNQEIGLLVTIQMLMQFVAGQVSGLIADRLGRRRTMLIFEMFSYALPCLIYAFSRNVYGFVVGAMFQGISAISVTAWNCLYVEDTPPKYHVHMFTLMNIAQLTAAFFSPIAGLLVLNLGLVPAVQALYIFAFVVMAWKTYMVYRRCKETERGKIRMEETRKVSPLSQIKHTLFTYRAIFSNKALLLVMGLAFVQQLLNRMNQTFLGTIIVQHFALPDEYAAYFAFIKSFITMACYFLVIPRIRIEGFKNPMALAFLVYALACSLLILPPIAPAAQMAASVALEALALSVIHPLIQSLTTALIGEENRAHTLGIVNSIQLLMVMPFGAVFGLLSGQQATLPYMVMGGICALAIALTFIVGRVMGSRREEAEA